MKATEAKLLEFMKKSPQFIIPIYQRSYSWSKKESRQLWDDIIKAGKADYINAHFIGSIVYIEKGIYHVTSTSPLLVIDGQQRLTTLTLLIAALADKLDELPSGEKEIIDGFSPRKLRNYYLKNIEEEGDKYYKLLLSKTDRETLLAIVDEKERPRDYSLKIQENYDYFKERIEDQSDNLEVLCKGIAKLIVVDIALSNNQDNPQLIFESMNSTGKELTQADLIRNYILMGLEMDKQTHLYEHYWRPMEVDFGQEAYTADFDRFMRHFLTLKTGKIPRISEVYEAFKEYTLVNESKNIDIEDIVKDIRTFSKYYCKMTLGQEEDKELKNVFSDIKELKVDVAYPLLLELYDDYAKDVLPKKDFIEILRLVESYVFRRNICSIPTNSLNKTFSTFMRAVDREQYLESVKAHFILLPSYRRFPNDNEFIKELMTKDLYNIPRRTYWFKKIENFDRKERVEVNQYTIEHIMPQNANLTDEWKKELGPEWERVHETWLHTIGNLTLTGYNSEYSDKPFSTKRDMGNGFRDSPIKFNQSLRNVDVWNEDSIKERAQQLSNLATKVWEAPKLSPDVLNYFKPKGKEVEDRSIDDYPYLSYSNGTYIKEIRELFDALRKEVLSMDTIVIEDHLRRYIAFKGETNFLDVVPQTKRLRLSLNMPYKEIDDPMNITNDVSNIGRWGNGDVEVGFSNMKDLPYIMNLVRQSFDWQMNEE
ncbi:MAG: DUF262 and DUF1524 domain-containing protein [Tetragenococcus koreensis]|uniref:Predicted transport protein n=1 Tax=Alkalibacterium gilvum TaxID=1130080 RepID=A0A1H6S388_9LACT|nr:DUF262 and DUF1524 domain-containing protein [Alkalibacterium gilvum]MDN6291080.1 DUF262 and DUF1524 domain-containing protein [Tetragenococcus koreensis]SEI62608.1 Predicted transport protein [Alkalibacterium gilvum]